MRRLRRTPWRSTRRSTPPRPADVRSPPLSVRGDDAHALAIENLDASREPARKKPVPNRRLQAEFLAPELERLARLDDLVLGQRSAHLTGRSATRGFHHHPQFPHPPHEYPA